MDSPIKVYDGNHNEIKFVISIDFKTGEIVHALIDKTGGLVIGENGIKHVKIKYENFSIEYKEIINEPGN
jgi:hypothetical protein